MEAFEDGGPAYNEALNLQAPAAGISLFGFNGGPDLPSDTTERSRWFMDLQLAVSAGYLLSAVVNPRILRSG